MGLFLAMAGIARAGVGAVEKALADFARAGGHSFARSPREWSDEDDQLLVSDSGGGRVVVMYPHSFFEWDNASAFLSRALGTPVFSFHIHDGDLWMYQLFVEGEPVDQFNPIPDYWDEDEEPDRWAGSADVVAAHWPGAVAAQLKPYLVRWDLDEDDAGKAYPDDRFARGTDWQLIDFMRRLGLRYPIDAKGVATGTAFTLSKPGD